MRFLFCFFMILTLSAKSQGWNTQAKESYYALIETLLTEGCKLDPQKANIIASCYTYKVTKKMTQEELTSLLKFEQLEVLRSYLKECSNFYNIPIDVTCLNEEVMSQSVQKAKQKIEAIIVGKWSDGTNTFNIYNDGNVIIQMGSSSKAGKWTPIPNGFMANYSSDGSSKSSDRFQILSNSATTLKLQSQDGRTFDLKKN